MQLTMRTNKKNGEDDVVIELVMGIMNTGLTLFPRLPVEYRPEGSVWPFLLYDNKRRESSISPTPYCSL